MNYLSVVLPLILLSAQAAAEALPPGHPPVSPERAGAQTAPALLPQKGKVLDVINVPQYTYVQVLQNKQPRWLAAPTAEVKKGDVVRFDNGLLMKDFHSNGLDRTFADITFVNSLIVTAEQE